MLVCQINTVAGTGSVGRIAVSLYGACVEHGMEAVVVYGRGHAPEGVGAWKMSGLMDFTCHVLRNFFLGESGFGSVKTTADLLMWLDEVRPDVIQLHNIHGFYINIELLFGWLKKSGIPVVWTLHDCWAFTGHCAYFDYVDCDQWKAGCQSCGQHRSAYPYAIFKDNARVGYRRKKEAFTGVPGLTLVTPSHWLAEKVGASFLREYPVEVIPNGVDLSVFKPGGSQRERGNSGMLVLGVANIWEKRKGLSYFVRLAGVLPENCHILLVGMGRRQRLALKAKECRGILPRGKVTMLGRTNSRGELARIYSEADVYVNTTLEDNFPTTNLEALACGTPVVTFDTGGSPESLDANTGFTVQKGNLEKLAEAVNVIAGEESSRREWRRKQCRERAYLFEKDACFQRYTELYERKTQKEV